MAAMQLSDELWMAIADALQSPVLRAVCRRLGALLRDRHFARRLTDHTAVPWLTELLGHPGLGAARSLTLEGAGLAEGAAAMDALARVLERTTGLRSLRVCLRSSALGAAWCRPLAAARLSRALESLHLEIAWDNRVEYPGPGWLEPLRGAFSLRYVSLAIPASGMTQEVAELASLRDIPQLRKLTVKGVGCTLEGEGARSLALVTGAKHLRDLTLHLGGDRLGLAGARALAELHAAARLWRLELDLSNNGMGPEGAAAVAALKDAPRLQVLHLNLSLNDLGPRGAAALATLRAAPRLHTLRLLLTGCEIGAAGAAALATLRAAPALRRLSLLLGDNQIGAAGAAALALGLGPREALTLGLEENALGPEGALALLPLAGAKVGRLNLQLAGNDIPDAAGATLLRALAMGRGLGAVEVELEDNPVGPATRVALAVLGARGA